MKLNLLSKFLITYVVCGVIGFFAITFICYGVDYKNVTSRYKDAMYKQAVSISSTYASSYFNDGRLRSIERELLTISELNETRIMFIEPNGNVILDTDYAEQLISAEAINNAASSDNDEARILYSLENFDYTLTGSNYSQEGHFYNVFDDSVISVMAPITNSFTTKGYVAIHLPVSVIRDNVYNTFNTNYITLIIMMVIFLSFIGIYLIVVHRPIQEVIHATDEYAKGNLQYKIEDLNNDEIGKLGASLNYMANELYENDKFQQKFISNVSHDFRSPLTSIKGYLEAIEDGTIPPEMVNKYINIVLFETERLTKLTSNILTLNDLDPKSVRLDITSFDINSIIKHTIETFEGTCKEKNISFNLTFSQKAMLVDGDKEKIQQVIYNLVDNAIKFSSEHSTIFISTTDRGGKVYTSVKDTGIGIPKESIDKIWDRFFKSDSSRGKDKKGSGLGLSITKEIIQSHNEHIDVISTIGVGTEFIFTLPKTKMDN